MQLTEMLRKENVVVDITATDKIEAITLLVDTLAKHGDLKDRDGVLKAVLDREAVRSTGVGQGFAIPHGKTAGVEQLVMAVGKLAKPIDFKSIDGKPVELIVLLISPMKQTGPHIQALARISRVMTDSELHKAIWSSASAEELYGHIEAYESRQRAVG